MTRYLRIDDHHQAMLVLLALRQFGAQASIRDTSGKADHVQTLTDRARTLCLSEEPTFSFAAILPADAPSGTYRLIHSDERRFAVGYALLDRDHARPLDELAAQLSGNLSLDPLPRAQPVEHIERRGFRLVGAQARA
jgi:hypothetical protein